MTHQENPDYQNQSRLLRLYAALSPSSPRQIACPPFPTDRWLYRSSNQAELFDLLVTQQPSLKYEGRSWKLVFWKRVITSIENAHMEPDEIEEEEVDGRILEYYISLQPSTPERFASLSTETRTYFYGSLTDRKSWSQIRLLENKASVGHGTTGLKSWGASVCLANYLILNPRLLHRSTILELGSGAGLLGILAHTLEPQNTVILTDCNPLVLERLQHNVHLNTSGKGTNESNLIVKHLDWNMDSTAAALDRLGFDPQPNLILAADVIYDPDLVQGLVSTIESSLRMSSPKIDHGGDNVALSAERKPVALICATMREPKTWESFITTCKANGLEVNFHDIQKAIELKDERGIVLPQAIDQADSSCSTFQLVSLHLKEELATC